MSQLFQSSPRRHSRGAILIFVLGLIMALTWVTIELLDSVRREQLRGTDRRSESELRFTAYQILQISMGVFAEIQRFEGAFYRPNQGWGNPLAYAGARTDPFAIEAARALMDRAVADAGEGASAEGSIRDRAVDVDAGDDGGLLGELLEEVGADLGDGSLSTDPNPIFVVEPDAAGAAALTVELVPIQLPSHISARVTVRDETGKLSLTGTSEARWRLFFEAMGFQDSEQAILTDSLLDWMDADEIERPEGAETQTYSQREPPYRAANRPLRDFDELRLIRGFEELFFDDNGAPNQYFRQFRDSVSFFNTGRVNLNTANALVLETLAEEQNFEAQRVLDFLAGPDLEFGTADDRILRPDVRDADFPRDEDGEPVKSNRTAEFLHLAIEVSSGRAIFELDVILNMNEPQPGGIYPFRIVRIFENSNIH
jgi:type II secretory pathway component PulK